ncbi:MAG: molecular chaperone TorD family protein [Clostridiales bacterium]|nr:molecular chaperone TorD family protein [Clostridiales bacterium]
MNDTILSIKEEATGREVAYALLGRLFERELGVEDALSIGGGEGGHALRAFAQAGIAPESANRVAATLVACDEGLVERVAIEYARLFCGHDRIYANASCWLSDRPRLMGDAWRDVLDCYHDEGLVPREEDIWLADHVGAELYFASVLSGRVARSGSANTANSFPDVLVNYLGTHVMTWIPRFFDRVAADPRAEFYADAARVGSEFLRVDAQMLGIDVCLAGLEGRIEEVRR